MKDYGMGIEYYIRAARYGNADDANLYLDLAIKYGSVETKMVKGVAEFHAGNISKKHTDNI